MTLSVNYLFNSIFNFNQKKFLLDYLRQETIFLVKSKDYEGSPLRASPGDRVVHWNHEIEKDHQVLRCTAGQLPGLEHCYRSRRGGGGRNRKGGMGASAPIY
jgi:hypothetical protein